MDSKKNFSTIDDLVAYTISQGVYDSKAKWRLVEVVSHEWDDLEAGKTWDAEDAPRWNSPEYEEYSKRCPAQHIVSNYWLERTGDHYFDWITLNGDLGAQVWAAWPKKQSRYGNYELSGIRTLVGLLKLMGRDEVGKQIVAARDELERKQNEQRRANVKAHIEKAAQELHEYLVKNAADHDVVSLTITEEGFAIRSQDKEN